MSVDRKEYEYCCGVFFDRYPRSEFLRYQAQKWRSDGRIQQITVQISVAIITCITVAKIVSAYVSANDFLAILLVLCESVVAVNVFQLVLVKELPAGGFLAYRLLERSVPHHYLFYEVDTGGDRSGSFSDMVSMYFAYKSRYPRVNNSMEYRLIWLSSNAYPKIFPWNTGKIKQDLTHGIGDCVIQVRERSGDKEAQSLATAIVILLLVFGLVPIAAGFPAMVLLHACLLLIVFFIMATNHSRMSYMAALIKILSDKWPWELRK